MRHFVSTLCFILFCGSLFSQDCPPNGDITFTTQEQIDNFATDYPGCTELNSLSINFSTVGINNLNGLSQLTSVNDLSIRNSHNLQNLNGLQNITNIEELTIANNNTLNSLSGLEGITELSGELRIESNIALTSLKGLENVNSASSVVIFFSPSLTSLEYLGGLNNVDVIAITINGSLTDLNGLEGITELSELIITDNSNLTSLSGLENLTTLTGSGLRIENNNDLLSLSVLSNLTNAGGGISIRNNPLLTNLSGLEGVTNMADSSSISIIRNVNLSDISALDILPYYENINNLNISRNRDLAVCSHEGICTYLAGGRPISIYDNSTGCNTNDELFDACGLEDPCPTNDIIFTSLSDIDSFLVSYPNCASIRGNLTITSSSLTNLNALSFLQIIEGDLNICNNPLLTNINGLSGVDAIGGDFWFKNNDAVTGLFNNFDFNGGLYIEDNGALVQIEGMTENMSGVTDLRIINNPNLFLCAIFPLSQFNGNSSGFSDMCSYLQLGQPSEISNNAPGCNSAEEIIGQCNSAPITLTYFQAKIDNKTTLLTWQTATETNNAGFEIQRSTDAINWEKIAWQDGQGTTTSPHTYTHRDENPLFGTSYYRLKQVDFDGAFEYTDIVQVNYEGRDISIFPNPVENMLHISDLNGENIQNIIIYDQTGKAIHAQSMPGNTIDVSTLFPGMYILKIAVKGEVFYRKFIVQER